MSSPIYSPKPYRQLGRGTPVPGAARGSMDCGPSSIRMALDAVTCGELVPTIDEIRKRMDSRGPVPTNTYDAERAVESYDAEMARYDRRRLVYDRYRGSGFEPLLRDAIKRGDPVQLAIHYGVFNRLTGRTGDPGFKGGHSVMVHGFDRRRAGGRMRVVWQLWDPLDDGRRTGIPVSPRWIRPGPLVGAWAAFGHYFGIIRGGERTL